MIKKLQAISLIALLNFHQISNANNLDQTALFDQKLTEFYECMDKTLELPFPESHFELYPYRGVLTSLPNYSDLETGMYELDFNNDGIVEGSLQFSPSTVIKAKIEGNQTIYQTIDTRTEEIIGNGFSSRSQFAEILEKRKEYTHKGICD